MKKSSLKSLLHNREWFLLLVGMFISRIGTFMQFVAINWHIYQLSKSPLSLGILGLSKFLPILLFSLIAGITADALSRKKIIFVTQLIAIINSFLLAYLTLNNTITASLIYLFVAIDSLCYTFETPARQSITPTIVEKKDLPLAININNIFYNLTNFIGPALSGLIIAYFSISTVYFINGFSFIFVIIALLLMKPLPHILEKPQLSFKGIKEGLKFVFSKPIIYGSMYIDFFATFFASSLTLLPIFAVDILKVGPKEMGLLYSAPSIGAVFGGLIFTFISKYKKRGRMLIASVVLYGAFISLFAISKSYYLSLMLLALSGSMDMISATIRNLIRHLSTNDHLRGRMTSINMIFYTGGPQLGEVEAGIAAYFMGTPQSVMFGGIITIIITLIISRKIPEIINYKDDVD